MAGHELVRDVEAEGEVVGVAGDEVDGDSAADVVLGVGDAVDDGLPVPVPEVEPVGLPVGD